MLVNARDHHHLTGAHALRPEILADGAPARSLRVCMPETHDTPAFTLHVQTRGGTLPADEVVRIGRQALAGLAYAHGRGVVHRDLKPHNLFLTEAGPARQVKVGDFGLAKAFDAAGLSGLTRTGRAAGTPSFVPRQQVIDFKNAKPEVDVWALAATLYALLTGRPPRDFPPGRDP